MDKRSKVWFEEVQVGMEIPETSYGPMDRSAYVRVAIILRDVNPLHLDREYARQRGFSDVVQQGPLNEAFLHRYLTDWLHHPWDLRRIKVRFVNNAFPGDTLKCRGTVVAIDSVAGEGIVSCALWQGNQKDETILSGDATFVLPWNPSQTDLC